MTARIITLAEAVKTALAGGSFSQSFTPTRSSAPEKDRADYSTLQVTVVPMADVITSATRNLRTHDFDIEISVQKAVAMSGGVYNQTTLDGLIELAQEIDDFLFATKLTGYGWIRSEWMNGDRSTYFSDDLTSENIFSSVIRITYRQIA